MAIKGKGRSKRRGVAAAPKPVYVQPKRPLFTRRAVWIPALALVLAGTIVGIVIGLSSEHHHSQQQALKAKEASIVDRFGHTRIPGCRNSAVDSRDGGSLRTERRSGSPDQ